jgi:hypothetical protein
LSLHNERLVSLSLIRQLHERLTKRHDYSGRPHRARPHAGSLGGTLGGIAIPALDELR